MTSRQVSPEAQTTRAADSDLLARISSLAVAPDDEWLTLPPQAYCSQEVFELEAEQIFRAGWMLLGREDQVATPGDFMCVDLLGESLVVVRDRGGVPARVVARVPPSVDGHMQRRAPGQHESLCLSLPRLDLRARRQAASAPEMHRTPGFDEKHIRLPEFRHEIWQGFVFVNLNGRAERLAPRLTPIDEEIAEYDLSSWVTVRTLDFGERPGTGK